MPKDENTKTETRNTMPAPRSDVDGAAASLNIPDGDVLIRYTGGPARGINMSLLGPVVKGRIYTVAIDDAARLCMPDGRSPQFEPVFQSDRTRIEAASKAIQKKD